MRKIKSGKYKIKFIAFMTFLVFIPMLFSCENISSDDINMGDLENILSVIIKEEETSTGLSEIQQANPNYSDIGGYSENVLDNLEASEDNLSDAPSENSENEESQLNMDSANALSGSPEASKILSNAAKYFPDIPDSFKYVPFPETVAMSDSLKQSIKNLDSLLKNDFGGNGFYIITTNPILFTPLLGSGSLNDVRRYRTQLVETAYNIKLQAIYMDRSYMYQTVLNSVNSGEYIADIVCAPLDVQSLFIQNGLLANLRKIPFMNLEGDYYNKSSVQAGMKDGEIYSIVSDLVFDPSKYYAFFYNKELLKDCGMDDLTSLYTNGEWTYDKMLEICKILTSNVDTAANDLFTVGLSAETAGVMNRIYAPDTLNYDEAQTDFVGKIEDIISRIMSNRDGISPLVTNEHEPQKNIFSQGSMMFSIMTLDIIPDITDSPFNWSILPLPSLEGDSDNQASFTFTADSALSISVLKGIRDTERCGIVTEALSIASYGYMRDMYVDDLMTYNLRDVTSVKMVDKIVNNVKYK